MNLSLIANKSAPTSRHVDDQGEGWHDAREGDSGLDALPASCAGTAAVLSAIAQSNGRRT